MVQSSAGSGPTAPAPRRAVVALEQGAVNHVAHIADLHSTATKIQDAVDHIAHIADLHSTATKIQDARSSRTATA